MRTLQDRGVALVVVATVMALSSVAAEHISSVPTHNMSNKERNELKEEAREMFYHAYRAYMDKAYPADELMPLSCTGRYRGVTPSRGDLDDVLGKDRSLADAFLFSVASGMVAAANIGCIPKDR